MIQRQRWYRTRIKHHACIPQTSDLQRIFQSHDLLLPLISWLLIGGAIAVSPHAAIAQRIPIADDTLGTERSQITPFNPAIDVIDGGARRGVNLFHSFRDFNVDIGRGVYFNNPAGVANILTRVTGGNPSQILGTLGVLGTANLFLLNPNGILFGANAQLDIRGSFLASTANSFKFSNGSEFSATTPQAPPLLSINVPFGLQSGTMTLGSTIANRGNLTTGQDLALESDRLDLQGQLVAGRDLTLRAADTVTARDTPTTPFVASTGGNLLVQGNQGVDIAALSHPNSGLFAGGNLVLRSDGTVGGDAHFYAGGNFQIEQLNGSPGNLLSPNDPIILTNGDVTLGDYTGASLHILAGGSVTLGNVTIDNTGATATTINPDNTTLFNGSKTYADLATFNLTDYKATLNSDGSVRSVDPVSVPITINGSTQATLDVRGGVDWAPLGGLPTSPVIVGAVTPAPTATGTATSANITVGNIRVAQPAGLVLLTNQFSPNALPGTISIRGNVDTSTNIPGTNGGDIRVYGRGDITVGAPVNIISLNSKNLNVFPLSNTEKGGAISLFSNVGSISLNRVSLGGPGSGGVISISTNVGAISATNASWSANFLGNPGSISFTTNSGNISLKTLGLSVANAATGNAGNISFATNSGNISLEDVNLYSYVNGNTLPGINAGNGGNISFATNSGNISVTATPTIFVDGFSQLETYSQSGTGNAGKAGSVSFATHSGNISLERARLSSYSQATREKDSDSGGSISFFTHSGNISLESSLLSSYSFSAGGTAGKGGSISFFTPSSGNISLGNSSLNSSSSSNRGNARDGGEITASTRSGNIFLGEAASTFSPVSLNSSSTSTTGNAGNGGAINLRAEGGTISGRSTSLNSFSVSQTGDSANGGKVTLAANKEISGLEITTSASNRLSGDVELYGFGNLLVANTRILTAQQVEVKSPGGGTVIISLRDRGQAGNVTAISTGSLTFSNSVIQSDSRGGNPAGDIMVRANQGITLADSSSISARTSSGGKAGNITFTAPTLVVAGDARVLAETAGTGDSGSIFVNAPVSVDLRRQDNLSPVLSVETSGAGQAGNITVNTSSLTLSEQARITATATATATNPQGGGSVTINASNLNLAGIVGVFAETQGQAPAGTLRLNPYTNQPDLNIALTPNSQISASTSGSGKGGDLIVTAPQSITIAGAGKLAVETSGTGNAGNINITTRQLTLKDGVEISASTSSSGKAGGVGINAETFTLSGGAKVSTNTSSSGAAGDLTVQVNDQLFLTGRGSGLFASTAPGSTGNGGNIKINSRLVQIEDGAAIAVNSQGRGTGGNISLQADRVTLNRQGSITAETASAQGGNISLDVKDILLLRRNSLISATAGTAQAGGDGGNITFNGKFIVAVPNENSDISANAFTGNGGRVQINAQGLFGIQFRPQLTPLSDITASSTFGFAGVVTINTPNVDPNRGLVQLPVDLTDASRLIVQNCPTGDSLAKPPNQFIITGRGGLPPTPSEAMNRDAIQVDLVTTDTGDSPAVSQNQPSLTSPSPHLSISPPPHLPTPQLPHEAIVEAQQLQIASDGTVYLGAAVLTSPIDHFRDRLIHCR